MRGSRASEDVEFWAWSECIEHSSTEHESVILTRDGSKSMIQIQRAERNHTASWSYYSTQAVPKTTPG